MYHVFPYYLSKTLNELWIQLLTPLILVTLTYYVAGFEHDPTIFFKTYIIMCLNLQCGSSLGVILATVSGSQ